MFILGVGTHVLDIARCKECPSKSFKLFPSKSVVRYPRPRGVQGIFGVGRREIGPSISEKCECDERATPLGNTRLSRGINKVEVASSIPIFYCGSRRFVVFLHLDIVNALSCFNFLTFWSWGKSPMKCLLLTNTNSKLWILFQNSLRCFLVY